MYTEEFIRSRIQQILQEQEETYGPGKGRFKKEIKAAETKAIQSPGELMKELNIEKVPNKGGDLHRLGALLKQAVKGTTAMSSVFGAPVGKRNTTTGKEGVRIPVKVIPGRDGLKYIEWTLLGAKNANYIKLGGKTQVELLGKDVLVYFGDAKRSWSKQAVKQDEDKDA